MKYVYIGGPYIEFRGYVFCNGKPTTILDKGTQIALAKRSDFSEVRDEPKAQVHAPNAPAAPVLTRPVLTLGGKRR